MAQQIEKAYPLTNEEISKGSNKQYSVTSRVHLLVKKSMDVLIKIQLHFCTAQNFRKLHMLIGGDITFFFQKRQKRKEMLFV